MVMYVLRAVVVEGKRAVAGTFVVYARGTRQRVELVDESSR
jgi:hypothetical protein